MAVLEPPTTPPPTPWTADGGDGTVIGFMYD